MAVKNYRVDDLDGTDGAEPHKLTLDGRTVVIDLSEANYGKLAGFLEPFFDAGTEKANDKGRIPDELAALYRQAQQN